MPVLSVTVVSLVQAAPKYRPFLEQGRGLLEKMGSERDPLWVTSFFGQGMLFKGDSPESKWR